MDGSIASSSRAASRCRKRGLRTRNDRLVFFSSAERSAFEAPGASCSNSIMLCRSASERSLRTLRIRQKLLERSGLLR